MSPHIRAIYYLMLSGITIFDDDPDGKTWLSNKRWIDRDLEAAWVIFKHEKKLLGLSDTSASIIEELKEKATRHDG